MSPETHRKPTGQWTGLCSSCKVVWETLRPGWEVFSREMEGERQRQREKWETFPFHLPPQQFNNVLFTPNSERMRTRRGGGEREKDAKRNSRKWRETNEEMQLKETYRDREEDTESNICFLITNHPIIIIMRKWQSSQKPEQQFWLALSI